MAHGGSPPRNMNAPAEKKRSSTGWNIIWNHFPFELSRVHFLLLERLSFLELEDKDMVYNPKE